jgi:hypothetical protein
MIEGNYKYEESRIQDLYMVLKKGGFNVYFPSTKMGECLSPYVVVKNDGLTKHVEFSTNLSLYSVMCYVPRDSYSKLESYKNKVKECIKQIHPLFKERGLETPSFYDDSVKAHMISISYENRQKII